MPDDPGRGGERNGLDTAVGLAQRDLRGVDCRDHAVVDAPVGAPGHGLFLDHLQPGDLPSEDLLDDGLPERKPGRREPEGDAERHENARKKTTVPPHETHSPV